MVSKKIMRDFQRCLRSVQSFSDNQASILEWDEDHLRSVTVQVRPNGGPYKGGKYDFVIRYESPSKAPEVNCLTRIYHPNIDPTCDEYNVCLNLLDEWQDQFGLEDVIQGILFLLYNPNLEDPLSPFFEPGMEEEVFNENLNQSLKGEDVESESFPENCGEDAFSSEEVENDLAVISVQVGALKVEEEEEEDPGAIEGEKDQTTEANTEDDEACNSVPVINSDEVEEQLTAEAVISEKESGALGLVHRQESKLDKLDTRTDADKSSTAVTEQNMSSSVTASTVLDYIPQVFVTGDRGLDTLVNVCTTFLHVAAVR